MLTRKGTAGRAPLGVLPEPRHSLLHQELVGEHIVDYFSRHMKIAHPSPAVSLRSIPDILLHTEVCRVGARIPDLGKQGVRTVETSTVPNRIVYVIHLSLQIYALFVRWNCDGGISERRVRARGGGGSSPWFGKNFAGRFARTQNKARRSAFRDNPPR